ncbi:uncharacterized protein LOC119423055 [Nematolebias whitei]|uniref:uncharacterized protein LOC119423055 n=1 Tax=Nematolebias whitei TaxID=451745 RepID=UPI001896D027|nr:uncharacterized protein LOC119423055 [Nematolebias whitei]
MNVPTSTLQMLDAVYHELLLMVSAAEVEVKDTLARLVGGNITFPISVKESGFLLKERQNIAMVIRGTFELVENIYQNQVVWDRNSGLFTITTLQKNNSGIYTIDNKHGQVSVLSYHLAVYDSPPTPVVKRLNVSSDSCWLLCSVDKPINLSWYRDQELLNQSSSELSSFILVHRQDRGSKYKCVAANPADNQTHHIDLRETCRFTESDGDNQMRQYWLPIGLVSVFIAFIGLCACFIKQRYIQSKKGHRQTQGSDGEVQYTPIHIRTDRQTQEENLPEPPGPADQSSLTTIYAKMEHQRSQTEPAAI